MTTRELCLIEILADLIKIEAQQLSLTMTLTEQGVDSLIGLRFARKIQDVYDTEVDLEWLFDYPTIRQLSQFLDERFGSLDAVERTQLGGVVEGVRLDSTCTDPEFGHQ